MQIITLDDVDFPDLVTAWKEATLVGRYWKNGKVQLICAHPQFVLISTEGEQTKIALKPARNLNEAKGYAVRILEREQERGTQVELCAELEK